MGYRVKIEGIKKQRDGTFRIMITKVHPLTGKRKTKKKILPAGTADLELVATRDRLKAELEQEVSQQESPLASKTLEEWCSEGLVKLRSGTQYKYLSELKRFVFPVIGNVKVEELTSEHLWLWRNTMLNKKKKKGSGNYKKSTLKLPWKILRARIKEAYPLSAILRKADPLGSFFWDVQGETGEKGTALTPDNFKKFWGELVKAEDPYRLVGMLQWTTGCRISEAVAIHKEDIDFESGVWKISKSYHLGAINPPKNKKPREAVLHSKVLQMIKEHADKIESGPLFKARTKSGYLPKARFIRFYREVGQAVGIEIEGTHQARRTFISLSKNKNDVVLRDIVGHATPLQTEHYISAYREEKAALVEDLFSSLGLDQESEVNGAGQPPVDSAVNSLNSYTEETFSLDKVNPLNPEENEPHSDAGENAQLPLVPTSWEPLATAQVAVIARRLGCSYTLSKPKSKRSI